MNGQIDKKIENNFRHATSYSEDLKREIWENISKEIKKEKEGETQVRNRSKKISKVAFVATLCGVFMGGTVLAKPIINELLNYFDEHKAKKVHDIESNTFIHQQTTLYESELNYLTYYDQEYFKVFNEGDVDYFRSKSDPNTYVSITLEDEKDFEVVLFEETGKQIEDIGVHLMDSTMVEVEYKEDQAMSDLEQVTMLCNGGELGTFVLRARYNIEDSIMSRMCHDIANEFIPLHSQNRDRIAQGKPQLHFEYDQEKYELVEYSSQSGTIYLQKKGVDLPDYSSDILFIYQHYMDETSEEKIMHELITHEENREVFSEFMKELEEEGKKHPESTLTTLKEVENDIQIEARKLVETKDSHESMKRIQYFIEDGQGGCYRVFIYLPYHEALKTILDTLEIKSPASTDMEYRVILDEFLG